LILLAAGSACAETLTPDAAQHFVTGKLFAFNCFDGSRGAGRIYGDGSVTGTIQFRGAVPCQSSSPGAETAGWWMHCLVTMTAMTRRLIEGDTGIDLMPTLFVSWPRFTD
jgi:hypothetical protein